ncbi:hypothetical protein ACIBCN_44405, partial [Nocardia sp. NPDC051052]
MAAFTVNMSAGQRIPRLVCRIAAALVLSIAGALPVGIAVADPPPSMDASGSARDGSHIVAVRHGAGRLLLVTVYSTAMNAPIDLEVLTAQDGSRRAPTLYLLNGASGGSAGSNWTD